MFETPATARANIGAHSAAPRNDALVALGLALLRPAPVAAQLGAEAGSAAQPPSSGATQLALVRAELRAGRQQRTFARGVPIV